MDVLTSTEFRKVYAKLRNPTIVTVNGHTIGRWLPGIPAVDAVDIGGERETRPVGLRPEDAHPRVPLTQAQRDAILRKVNRTGRQ